MHSVGDRCSGCFFLSVIISNTTTGGNSSSCALASLPSSLDVTGVVTGSETAGSHGQYSSTPTKCCQSALSSTPTSTPSTLCESFYYLYHFNIGIIRPFHLHPPHPSIIPHYGFSWLREVNTFSYNYGLFALLLFIAFTYFFSWVVLFLIHRSSYTLRIQILF